MIVKGSGLHLRSAFVSATVERVLAEVQPIADRFSAARFSLYLVGGIVRDLDLGFEIDELDFDLTTDARPPEIKRLVSPIADAVWDQGERFGTIGCKVAGRAFEITTHRAEWYESDSRKPAVRFGDDVLVDLSRRDFTVNAMAISVFDGVRLDPFDGRGALERKELRTPIDPEISFRDDPLRILRAARFVARYALKPDAGVADAAGELADRLEIVSEERIRDELDKLLVAPEPSAGMRFLGDVGALDHALPFLDVGQIDRLGGALDRSAASIDVRRAVLYAHVSADRRPDAITRLRYSNDETAHLVRVTGAIDRIREHPHRTDEDIRRLVDRVGLDRMSEMWHAAAATLDAAGVADARRAFEALAGREDLSSLEPTATGADVMEALGVEPGPDVGEMLRRLRERRLVRGPSTLAEELAYLRRSRSAD